MMRVISPKDETVRVFKSDFFEFFSRVHWSIPLILYVPVFSYFILQAFLDPFRSFPSIFAYLLLGLLSWSAFEYVIHRFFFHFEPKTPWLQRIFYTIHGIHHAYPSDSWRLVMPPVLSIPLAFFLYFTLCNFLGPQIFRPFFAGLGIGYLSYDMIHYATHHRPMSGRIGTFLKKYHLRHHFQQEDRGFGVSSPLWDYILGTTPSSKK